jgi:hypothetical protein
MFKFLKRKYKQRKLESLFKPVYLVEMIKSDQTFYPSMLDGSLINWRENIENSCASVIKNGSWATELRLEVKRLKDFKGESYSRYEKILTFYFESKEDAILFKLTYG